MPARARSRSGARSSRTHECPSRGSAVRSRSEGLLRIANHGRVDIETGVGDFRIAREHARNCADGAPDFQDCWLTLYFKRQRARLLAQASSDVLECLPEARKASLIEEHLECHRDESCDRGICYVLVHAS